MVDQKGKRVGHHLLRQWRQAVNDIWPPPPQDLPRDELVAMKNRVSVFETAKLI
jgi:hypothetical protein